MISSLLTLALMILLVGVLLLGATVLLMALMLLRPPRMTDGKAVIVLRRLSPGDLGLRFEEARFDVRDRRTGRALPIAGWWIPHARGDGKCVVLVHGYADAKVGAIAWAPLWHDLGYNILAIDLRAHGYSGGKDSTAGFWERHDLDQVLDQLLAERADDARRLVLFGVSLGAAVALGTAEMRDDVEALVLECPYARYANAVDAHARVMQMPLPTFVPLAVRLAERISGADFGAVSPAELLKRVTAPAMLIHGANDPFVPRGDVTTLAQVMRERAERGIPSQYWLVDGAAHVMGIVAGVGEYRRRIVEFLKQVEPRRREGAKVEREESRAKT